MQPDDNVCTEQDSAVCQQHTRGTAAKERVVYEAQHNVHTLTARRVAAASLDGEVRAAMSPRPYRQHAPQGRGTAPRRRRVCRGPVSRKTKTRGERT